MNYWIFFALQFYEELVHGKGSGINSKGIPSKPLNKKIVFASSSSDDDDDDDDGEEEEVVEGKENDESGEVGKGAEKQSDTCGDDDASNEQLTDKKSNPHDSDNVHCGKGTEGVTGENREDGENHESQSNEAEEPPAKKQCLEADASKCVKVEEKSIDKLIEAELEELGDKNKVSELADNLGILLSHICIYIGNRRQPIYSKICLI